MGTTKTPQFKCKLEKYPHTKINRHVLSNWLQDYAHADKI